MTKEKLVAELEQLAENGSTYEELFKWFVKLNKKYKKLKKEGKVTDEILFELADFFSYFSSNYGPEMIEWLEDMWNDDLPTLLEDIYDFVPKYNKMNLEKTMNKMDPFEIKEAELLFDAAWKKNCRFSVTGIYYDWDSDDDMALSINVPRDEREEYEVEFKQACALVIYNRGSMVFRFFAKRGRFEVAGVSAINGSGEWRALTEDELSSFFENGLSSMDSYITLKHEPNNEIAQPEDEDQKKILYFSGAKK